jgi:GNAT superfamily N-acetyltransferase
MERVARGRYLAGAASIGGVMAGSATESVTVGLLDPADAERIASFYRTVLVPHFIADELDTEQNFAAGLRLGGTRALVATVEDGTVVGGAVTDWFARSNVLLLSYIAVLAAHRSTGAGAALMAAVSGSGSAGLRPLLLVAEVEDPRHFASDPAHGDPWARWRFYQRLGGRTLPLPYAQPALGPGRSRVPHLLLMVLGGSMAPAGAERVDGETVELFLREYFEGCEGPVQPGDSQLQALLAACRVDGGLPLLPPGELPEQG